MNTQQLETLFPFAVQAITESKQKQFEVLLNSRIQNTVNAHSLLRKLGDVKHLKPEDQASYTGKKNMPIFILPKSGYIPLYFVEGSDDFFVPIFNISQSMDISLKYVEQLRVDILNKTISALTSDILSQEDDSLFRLLVPAASTNIINLTKNIKQKKYNKLSFEVIKNIIKQFKEESRILTHLVISKDELNDLIEEQESRLFKLENNTITFCLEEENYYITLIEHKGLGSIGKYNINSSESSYGIFKVNSKGKFNDYKPKKLNNVVEKEDKPYASSIGETQVYALDLSSTESPIKVPIKKEFELFADPAMHRHAKLGYYGWEELGAAISDPSFVKMIVIDRSKNK